MLANLIVLLDGDSPGNAGEHFGRIGLDRLVNVLPGRFHFGTILEQNGHRIADDGPDGSDLPLARLRIAHRDNQVSDFQCIFLPILGISIKKDLEWLSI